MQALSGVLVLDFTTLLPGPLATLMLAEAGAEVIKVERPGGEEMRAYPLQFDGGSALFAMLNRGKRSVVLDLKQEADRARLAPLLERADVLVEQFRPGVMERLGLGYEAVAKRNPRLVYCSISGYGQRGPRAEEAGHDLNYMSNTGLLALQPGPADRPVVPPALVADIGGGTMPAVINILLALRQRDATGQGCHLDIAMADAMFTFAWYALAIGQVTGKYPKPGELPLAALPALSDARRQARRLRGAGAEVLARLLPHDRSRARARERPRGSGRHEGRGRRHHRRRERGALGAEIRRRRLLRHHRPLARGSAARSALRRARPVHARGERPLGPDHAGTARADRAAPARRREDEAGAGARSRNRGRAEFAYGNSPRMRRGCAAIGITPSRITARRSGPMRSSR